MADQNKSEASKTDNTKNGASRSFISRSMMPYLIAAFLAAGTMGWYFFVFVPGQFNYFVGSRFRILAVATGQAGVKIQNLQSSVNTASEGLGPQANFDQLKQYLDVLVPEIRLSKEGRSSGLALTLDKNKFGEHTAASVSWDDVMGQSRVVSMGYFQDLILADDKGDVVWQREKATPRIGNLQELLNAQDVSAGWLPISLSWAVRTSIPKPSEKPDMMPKTAVLKAVNLNGQPNYIMIQAADAKARFFVAAAISSKVLQSQAMHIPALWVVLFALPVALLFLALPFVKLATLTSKERYGFSDIVLMAVAAIVAAGLGAILLFVPSAVNDEADKRLVAFANQIETKVSKETKDILHLTEIIQHNRDSIEGKLQACAVELPGTKRPKERCQLWTALKDFSDANLELDVAIWVNSDGEQTEKWSTKRQVTGNTSHLPFRHFADMKANHTWKIANFTPFTIDPVRSPTTSEMGFIFAVPVIAKKVKPNDLMFLLNVRPRSLVDTLLPPGYGFAILAAQTGRVLFHSEDGLSLEEDFFQEVGDAEGVREKAWSGRSFSWTEDYHGRRHRLFMTPFTSFEGSPWRIVTFQELDPLLASEFHRQSEVFWLGSFNSMILALTAFLFWGVLRLKRAEARDVAVSSFSFNPGESAPSWISVTLLGGLTVAAFIALVLTRLDRAQHWLDVLYVFFALLPLLAIALYVFGRTLERKLHTHDESDHEASKRNRAVRKLVTEFLLLLLLIGALPAAGFKRIVYRYERFGETERWLEAMQQNVMSRSQRLLDRVNGPGYDESTTELLKAGFARPEIPDESSLYSYVSILPGVSLGEEEPEPPSKPWAGQAVLLWLLEAWNEDSSPSSVTSVKTKDGKLRLRLAPAPPALAESQTRESQDFKRPTLSVRYPAGHADYNPWNLSVGLLILFSVSGGIAWAVSKLVPRPVVRSRDLQTQIFAPSKENRGILLLGPPRTSKDRKVELALMNGKKLVKDKNKDQQLEEELAKRGERLERIRLLDAKLDQPYIDRQVTVIRQKFLAVDNASNGERPRAWIHISNLESQLTTVENRALVLQLFEKLLERRNEREPVRVLIVTSTIDPIEHFKEIFEEERRHVYKDAVPEVELSRSALVLSRFSRCYSSLGDDESAAAGIAEAGTSVPVTARAATAVAGAAASVTALAGPAVARPTVAATAVAGSAEPGATVNSSAVDLWKGWRCYNPADWQATAAREVQGCGPLKDIPAEIQDLGRNGNPTAEELARAIKSKARAYYELLWASCTRSEKLVLIQLAQEGFLNPKSRDLVTELVGKGLIVECPAPATFNYTFRAFVRGIERNQIVQQWERQEGNGLWVVAGKFIGSSLIAGGLFYLLTQDFSVQSLLPVISGTGIFGVPLVRSLIARLTGRPDSASA